MNISLTTNKNNYYCLRFRVHKRLIPFFKKTQISKSLYTKDKKIAKLKANKLYYPYQQILNTLTIITTEQTQQLVDTYIEEQLEQHIMKVFTINSTKYKLVSKTTLQEAYDKFCSWYKQQKITQKQYLLTTNKLHNSILPFFGLLTNIEDITLEAVEEFKEFLYSMPNTNLIQYKKLSYIQITQLSNIPKEHIIGISTQIKYLKILKQFFLYVMKANILSYNPCSLLTMPNNTISNREPFNEIELKNLFNFFTTLDDRKYIYFALAYSGMRPSELWKCKVSTSEDNIIYFDLEDKDLQLKTMSSYRVIPLHYKLLEMGIDKKLSSLQLQFTQAGVSSYFNKTIKPTITDNPNKIMYSFRHTVATELKRAETIHMDKVSELLGHTYEHSSMTKEVYAQGYTMKQLQEAINYLPY